MTKSNYLNIILGLICAIHHPIIAGLLLYIYIGRSVGKSETCEPFWSSVLWPIAVCFDEDSRQGFIDAFTFPEFTFQNPIIKKK